MIDRNELKAAIVRRGLLQKDVAAAMGTTQQAFSRKMKAGVFDTDEVFTIIKLLEIDNPIPIFFADNVTSQLTEGAAK